MKKREKQLLLICSCASLTAEPRLIRKGSLQMEQQGLGFKLQSPFQQRDQHAVPDLSEWVRSGVPVPTRFLMLRLGL